MTQSEALSELQKMSKDLTNVDYNDILGILRHSIKRIPIPLARLHAHTNIDRVRKNNGDNLFSDVQNDLSYIKDPAIINGLTEFGRCNKPHQILFYGSIPSTNVKTQRITALAETSALFQDKAGVNLKGELYTVSRWINTEILSLAEIVFAQAAIDSNPDIKRAFNFHRRQAVKEGFPDMDFFTEFLIFISEQFARPKKTHDDYKIATAYAELAFHPPDVQGIAFPSVQTDYWGQNLVFPPPVIDKFLEVKTLAVQRFHKNKDLHYLNNFKNCESPQDCLTHILWADLAPEHIATDAYIQAFLAGKIQ